MGSRPNRILALVVGLIVIVAAVVAVFAARRPVAEFDAGSPERAVQTYLSAVLKGDHDAAAELLDPDGPCEVGDLDRVAFAEPARAYLVGSDVEGSNARVTVRVALTAGGGPLDTSEVTQNHVLRLTRTGGEWLITGTPWPLYTCEGEGT
jgi:hypothetical protein